MGVRVKKPLTMAWLTAYMHIAAAIVHFVMLAVTLGISISEKNENPVKNQVLSIAGIIQNSWYLDVPVYTSVFYGITSVFHAINAYFAYKNHDTWHNWVERGSNPIRWIEYSLTASWMMVLISVISSVTDVWELSYVFMTIWVAMLLGLIIDVTFFANMAPPLFSGVAEQIPVVAFRPQPFTILKAGGNWPSRDSSDHNDSKLRPLSWGMFKTTESLLFIVCYFVSTCLVVVPWIRVWYNFGVIGANIPADLYGFVLAVILVETFLFLSFAIVMAVAGIKGLHVRRYSEFVYIILSFVAKLLLGVLVLAGGMGTASV